MDREKDSEKPSHSSDRVDMTNEKELIEENSEAHTPELDGPATEDEAAKLLAVQPVIDLSEHGLSSEALEKAIEENKREMESPPFEELAEDAQATLIDKKVRATVSSVEHRADGVGFKKQ